MINLIVGVDMADIIIINKNDVYFEISKEHMRDCKKNKPTKIRDVGKGSPQIKTEDDLDYVLFCGLYFYKTKYFTVWVKNKNTKEHIGTVNFDFYDEKSEMLVVDKRA